MDALFDKSARTGDIVVRVATAFLPERSQPHAGSWMWSYHIRIENLGDTPVRLLTRRWEITDGHGDVHVIEGDGVVGDQPVIGPGERYDYVSGCPLTTPQGHMIGSYGMMDAHGQGFRAAIPGFALRSPAETS
jgi:ApaG protein